MSDKPTSGEDIRELVKFAAFLGRVEDGMSQQEAYQKVYDNE